MLQLKRWLVVFNQSKLGELFRYGMVGGTAFLIWIFVLVFLVELFGVDEVLASAIGFIIATPINYILQKLYVFKAAANLGSRFYVYCVITVAALGVNIMLFWVLMNATNIHYTLAQIITATVIMFMNYYVNRTYTFSVGVAK
jgi:putative flippase GtrA